MPYEDIGPLHPRERPLPAREFLEGHQPEALPAEGTPLSWLGRMELEPLCAYAWEVSPGWELEPRSINDSMWFYFEEWSGEVRLGKDLRDTLPVRSGQLLLLPEGTPHALSRTRSGGLMRTYSVHFHPRLLGSLNLLTLFDIPPLMPDGTDLRWRDASYLLAREHALQAPGYRALMQGEIRRVLIEICRAHARPLPPGRGTQKKLEYLDRLAPVIHWLEQRLFDPRLRVEEAGAVLNVSAEYMRRLFREGLGISPRAYVIQRRMEKAASLLITTNLRGNQISRELGFPDPAYFHRTFTRFHGMPPRAYRENILKRP